MLEVILNQSARHQLSKKFETILKNHIINFLETRDLRSSKQCGFRKGKSCSMTTNLIIFNEDVTREINDNNSVDIVYSDFQKAFDKVLHQTLLHKLQELKFM